MRREADFDAEKVLVNVIQNAIDTFQRRVAVHYGKDEVSLTADLEEKIEMTLAEMYDIHIKREYNMGRALKGLGETDLYFYRIQENQIIDLAILENKVIEKFRDQYYQLMGYLNPNFRFGLTVSINRHLTLDEARMKIEDTLRSVTGDYALTEDIRFFPEHENRLMSTHTVPETGKKIHIYHFILNLEDGSRQEAAKQGREKHSAGTGEKKDSVLAHFRKVEEVEEKETRWVIPDWIPRGGITLLVGDGGVGKTNLWSYLVSRLSAGLPTMLDDEHAVRELKPGNVAVLDLKQGVIREKVNTACLYFSKEDSTSDRLKKQFRLYEANMEKIGMVDVEHLSGFTFASKELEDLIVQERPTLVVFDPLQGFFPAGASMLSRQQSRETLDRLVQLAQGYDTAFLLVCHTNKKSTSDWRERITGSADLADIARSVIFTSYTDLRLEDKPGCRVRYISNEKNSYAPQEMTVLYTIEGDGVVSFVGASDKRFADYAAEKAQKPGVIRRQKSQKEICRELILHVLEEGGKKKVRDLNEELSSAGMGRKAMDQAKAELEREGTVLRWNEPAAGKPCWYIRLAEGEEGEEVKKPH